MRLQILSDLHLEFAPFEIGRVEADVLVLAGDVHTGKNGIRWILQQNITRPVVYVLGNHEFYGQKIPKLTEEIKAIARGSHVHVLEHDRVELFGVVFLGATLWTDFRLHGSPVLAELAAQTGMTDFRRIRTLPSYRRFRPVDARMLCEQSKTWLGQAIAGLHGRKSVIVTHHAPSSRSVPPAFERDPLSPAYASHLDSLIGASGVALWIHGHIHQSVDYTIGSTRVVSNPRGYPSEPQTGFDPSFVVEV